MNHLIRHIEKDPTYGRGSWVFAPFETETQACLCQDDDSMQCIIFSFRKEFSQVWHASTSLSQFVSRSFLLELVAFTLCLIQQAPQSMSRLVMKRRKNSWFSNSPRLLLCEMTAKVSTTLRSHLYKCMKSLAALHRQMN